VTERKKKGPNKGSTLSSRKFDSASKKRKGGVKDNCQGGSFQEGSGSRLRTVIKGLGSKVKGKTSLVIRKE